MTATASAPWDLTARVPDWVVHGSNGSETVFLADYHRTTERKDGLELQFFDYRPEFDRRVATVRPGAWHWVAEDNALEGDSDDD